MDVRLPDGTIVQNVPDGTTKADLVTKLRGNGMAVPAEWLGADTLAPTARQSLLSSGSMRLAKGGKDPIDGAAQLLQRVLPDGVVNAVNKAADFVGGEGTFAGDVLGIKGMTPKQLTNDISSSNAEYEQARKATGQTGFDGSRFAGNVLSPVNAATARVLPVGKIGNTNRMLAFKGAAAGVAGAATQPVMGDEYWLEKGGQAALGAASGAVLTPLITKAADSTARFVRDRVGAGGGVKSPEVIAMEIKSSLAMDGIDVGQIPKAVMDKLSAEVQQAMNSGKQVDAPTLLRKMDFDRAGVNPLLGQLTRDPTQYTNELNLRGVPNVGAPIANRLSEQQAAISSRFRHGTSGAQSGYEAGQSLINRLQSKDTEMQQGVRGAYSAFRNSTGKNLDVPLPGLAQDYTNTLRDFGQTIPSAVRGQFEELGLTGAKQLKVLSIDDAERLIKTINKNYNPADRAQARALDELRGAVQKAVTGVADEGGSEAAQLAQQARAAASKRFGAIDSSPALKAAINAAEPDDFVKKYVINGKVREIADMADLVGPEGQKTMQQQMMKYLESKAFGANAARDGSGAQASFNRELQSIGRDKLAALLGASEADDLFALGRVMAYIQQRPAGSAVNESSTGAMIAGLLGRIGGTIKGAPYINDFIVKPIGAFQDRGAVSSALAAKLPEASAQLDPATVNRLARMFAPAPVAAGAALGYGVR